MINGSKYKFKRIDTNWYSVEVYGVEVGEVYRDPDAWSYAPWFIGGIKQVVTRGGVNQSIEKPRGFGTRERAAYALSVSQSAKILAGKNNNRQGGEQTVAGDNDE